MKRVRLCVLAPALHRARLAMLDIVLVLLVILLPAALVFVAWHRARRGVRSRARTWLSVGLSLLATLPFSVTVLWELARSRTVQLRGELVSRVETQAPVVALTFDDGPSPGPADEVLDLLKHEGVRATFYVTGAGLAANPGLGRRLVEEGHVLGNHSFSHGRMVPRTGAWMAEELARTDALIREAGHQGPITFRAPYGKHLLTLPSLLVEQERLHVMFDVEPESDPEVAASAEKLAARVLEHARPGSIILLHPWARANAPTRAALPAILAGLRARGLRMVTVPELLAMRAAPPGS